jgi:hypothetical protein
MACPEGLGTARDERSESRRFHDGLADAASSLMEEARPAGLEPAAPGLEGRCSYPPELRARVFYRKPNGDDRIGSHEAPEDRGRLTPSLFFLWRPRRRVDHRTPEPDHHLFHVWSPHFTSFVGSGLYLLPGELS